jgi:hypothetical protein
MPIGIKACKIGYFTVFMLQNTRFSFDDLKSFVYRKLCEDHRLLHEACSTSESVLRRGNSEMCGIMFHLQGPRKTLFTAVWDGEENQVFFYRDNGSRYRIIHGIGLDTPHG